MLKHLIILPDKTELGSGVGTKNAVMGVNLTDSVNVGDELTIGSTFANILEASVLTPAAGISVTAGDEVTLYKVDEAGNRTKKGIYILEKPTRPSANTLNLTGYDRIIKLDKDLTAWLQGLDGWPYQLIDFAAMVCEACGLTLATTEIPNADFPVKQFIKSGVTGRQLMSWIGEICCRFCRANADGEIEFAWYEPSGKTITPSGSLRSFVNSLAYDTFQVTKVDAVQIRLAESSDGALWPTKEASNPYVITGNAILLAQVTKDLLPYLEIIEAELADMTYTPCKVSIPATLDIQAGQTVGITDANGATITALVMTKTTKGQRDTLQCTGSAKRDSSSSVNNKTAAQIAHDAVESQTSADMFNRLTKNGEIQGIYVQDGKLVINGEFAKIINLVAEAIVAGVLSSADGTVTIDLTNNKVTVYAEDKSHWFEISGGSITHYSKDDNGNAVRNLQISPGADATSTQIVNENGPVTVTGSTESHFGNLACKNVVEGGSVIIQAFSAFGGSGNITITAKGKLEIQGKAVSWLDNGDGTFSMIGQ